MLEFGLIIGAVLLYFCVVTCTFLAVQIARLKGRRRAWGWLGLLLGPIGVLLVCFIPNAKGVEGETNPVKMAFKKLTAVSPVVTWIFLAGIVLVVGGALAATRLTTYFENRTHEKELSVESGNVSTRGSCRAVLRCGQKFGSHQKRWAVWMGRVEDNCLG